MKASTRQMIELALTGDATVDPQVKKQVTEVLDGKSNGERSDVTAPLLLTMTDAASCLGVSRVTLWRMVKAGVLQPVEIMPGIRRIRRGDLLRL